MNPTNKIMLITYPDSLGTNLNQLGCVIDRYFTEAVGSIHILPFFPSSADRGFAPTDYQQVDPVFGSWPDVRTLAKTYPLMFDFMINHLSRQSKQFKDFLLKKETSQYRDLFIDYDDFWPDGRPTQQDIDSIYKRKDREPYIDVEFADGSKTKLWCTFGDEQIDLDVNSKAGKDFIKDSIVFLARNGGSVIRLDAFAYTIKKPGQSCFFEEPEVWQLLAEASEIAASQGAIILPEIHEHYSIQIKLADQGYWVYDFALPMLVLHALYTGRSDRLANWLRICPRHQFTTLDTHDGIGVVDAKDLLSDSDIELTRDLLYEKGANVKRVYSSEAYNNLDIYQINCTYYSALGNDDQAYLLARAIQFFAPGIPQVYYVGLLAGKNDIERLEETRQGREINRHSYTEAEIETEVKRPVVQQLIGLMCFRNSHPAFDGEIILPEFADDQLIIERRYKNHWARLEANLNTFEYAITHSQPD